MPSTGRGRDPELAPATLASSPRAFASVAAVVLNWNLPSATAECIRHLLASDYPNLSIFVVDNGSADDSVSSLRGLFPSLDLLALSENRGYAGGNNAGIARALARGADYVLLVNNDAVLAPNAITRLLGGIGPGAQIATPRIDRASSNQLWHVGARLGRLNPLPRAVTEADLVDGKPLIVDFAVGCVLLVRRDVFERIGLLDERYFLYYEDLDFSTRARAAGFQIVAVPTARAWHEVGSSTRHDNARHTYLLMRYRTVWCQAQSLDLAGFAWWLTFATHLVRATIASVTARDGRIAVAALQGARDGFFSPESHQARIPRVDRVEKSGEF